MKKVRVNFWLDEEPYIISEIIEGKMDAEIISAIKKRQLELNAYDWAFK